MSSTLHHWLERFDTQARKHMVLAPHTLTTRCGSQHPLWAGDRPAHIVIGCLIHGNEYGSLPAVVEWLESEPPLFSKIQVSVILGNPAAGRADQRFLEQDLNRMFHPQSPDCRERRRAQELQPLLNAADLFIDFHQTIEPTDRPFFIFGYHKSSAHWARLLSLGVADTWVTRAPGKSFAPGQLCADEYARERGCAAVTLELSQKGFCDEATKRVHTLLQNMENLLLRENSPAHQVFQDTTALAAASANAIDLCCYEIQHHLPFAKATTSLRPGLSNFTRLQAGENVSPPHSKETLTVPTDCFALFPKYPLRDASGAAPLPLPGQILNCAVEVGLASELDKLWSAPPK